VSTSNRDNTNTNTVAPSNGLTCRDISGELEREIVMVSSMGTTPDGKQITVESVYVIKNPVKMYTREGGVTMRILDAQGKVHLVPGIGYRGTVHRWTPKDPSNPVQF
jgi:hypothetical protein